MKEPYFIDETGECLALDEIEKYIKLEFLKSELMFPLEDLLSIYCKEQFSRMNKTQKDEMIQFNFVILEYIKRLEQG